MGKSLTKFFGYLHYLEKEKFPFLRLTYIQAVARLFDGVPDIQHT